MVGLDLLMHGNQHANFFGATLNATMGNGCNQSFLMWLSLDSILF